MEHKMIMLEQMKRHFDEREMYYEVQGNCIKTGYAIDCKLTPMKMLMLFEDDGYLALHIFNAATAEKYRDEVLRYINMVNYTIRIGSFEMDTRDGEVRFRMYVRYEELTELSEKLLAINMLLPYATIKRWSDGLAAVMMGFSDAETAFKKARQDEDE